MQAALPYVYKLVQPGTGEFYIGSRCANTEPWDVDLPKYRTSSKYVKPRFDEFRQELLMEFQKPECAYDYEQHMINESWGDPLMLNKSCKFGAKIRFSTAGTELSEEFKANLRIKATGRKASAETKAKMSETRKGRKVSEEQKAKISAAKTGKKRAEFTEAHKEKLRKAGMGRKLSDEAKAKLREKATGRKLTQEAIEKIRQSKIGSKNCVGRKYSPETIEKMRKSALAYVARKKAEKEALISVGEPV